MCVNALCPYCLLGPRTELHAWIHCTPSQLLQWQWHISQSGIHRLALAGPLCMQENTLCSTSGLVFAGKWEEMVWKCPWPLTCWRFLIVGQRLLDFFCLFVFGFFATQGTCCSLLSGKISVYALVWHLPLNVLTVHSPGSFEGTRGDWKGEG